MDPVGKLQENAQKWPLIYLNDIEYIVNVLFNDNSYLLIGMNVGNLTDSEIVNLSYIENRLCSDLQKYSLGYN
jgi:hypothetical protein